MDELLEVPSHRGLVGYICLGYPMEEEDQPQLEKLNWQQRLPLSHILIPLMLPNGAGFWVSLIAGCALTIALYTTMIAFGAKLGIRV